MQLFHLREQRLRRGNWLALHWALFAFNRHSPAKTFARIGNRHLDYHGVLRV
jgi:hypothetical protein